jgi:hypothetical protein
MTFKYCGIQIFGARQPHRKLDAHLDLVQDVSYPHFQVLIIAFLRELKYLRPHHDL